MNQFAAFACLMPVVLAGESLAQCDIYWPGVPDFDQRRGLGSSIDPPAILWPLPGDGAYFCVPTSAMNWLALIDSAGFNAMPGVSTQNWYQQHPVYTGVRDNLFDLGDNYMGTGSDSGTSFGGGTDGLQDWFDDRNLGDRFHVYGIEYDGDFYPRPKAVYNRLKSTLMTSFCYGRYYRDGDQLEREGGHCVTAVGVYDACDTQEPEILYHDPNTNTDSDPLWVQSPFKTKTRTFYRRYLNMDGDMAVVYAFEDTEVGTSTEPLRVLDTIFSISTAETLGTSPINPFLFHVIRAVGFPWQPAGPSTVNTPHDAPIIDLAYDHAEHAYLVALGGVVGQAAGLFAVDPADHTFSRLHTFARDPDRILVDRFGHHYVQLGTEISKYKLVDDRPVLIASRVLPAAPNAWAYDDATDALVMLTTGMTRVHRTDRSLTSIGDTLTPGGAAMGGEGSVAINPLSGRAWITSSVSPAIYELMFDAASGRASIASQATHATLRRPRGLQFDHLGRLFAACDGAVRHFALGTDGRWAPVTDGAWNEFRSLPMGRLMDMTRPRDNRQARHTGPAWLNFDPAGDDAPEVVDCPGDFNLDGSVDFFDYDDFVRCFERLGCPRGRDADVERDGSIDFFDYDRFIINFEEGC